MIMSTYKPYCSIKCQLPNGTVTATYVVIVRFPLLFLVSFSFYLLCLKHMFNWLANIL